MESKPKNILRFSVVALIIFSVLLSGCMDLDVVHTIEEDGNSKLELTMDLTMLMEQMKNTIMPVAGGGGTLTDTTPDKLTCEQFLNESSLPEFATNVKCKELAAFELKVDYEVDLVEQDVLTIEERDGKKYYSFNLDDLNKIMSGSNDSSQNQLSADDSMSPKALGMTYTYTLVMPGKITPGDIGEIDGNTIKIDMAEDYANVQGLVIESEFDPAAANPIILGNFGNLTKNNMTIIIIAICVLVLVIMVVIIIYIKMGKKKPKTQEHRPIDVSELKPSGSQAAASPGEQTEAPAEEAQTSEAPAQEPAPEQPAEPQEPKEANQEASAEEQMPAPIEEETQAVPQEGTQEASPEDAMPEPIEEKPKQEQ